MTWIAGIWVVSVLLLVAGGAMVALDRRRGGQRVAREEPAEEVDRSVSLFEPPPRRSQNDY